MGGGTVARHGVDLHRPGASPRARGNRAEGCQDGAKPGSIPAWAGEPRHEVALAKKKGEHPRVGGGTQGLSPEAFLMPGASPRGRGNRGDVRQGDCEHGTIPAWAGEPG